MAIQKRSRRAVELSAEQEADAQRIYEKLRVLMDAELLAMARLMAGQPDSELLGRGRSSRCETSSTRSAPRCWKPPSTSGLKKGCCGAGCACSCGRDARFVNWRSKQLMSLFGAVRIAGSYYHCANCRSSQQPWDAVLRLSERRVTPAAAEAISLAGLLTSFGRAAEQTLKKLTGIVVSESTVQRRRRRGPEVG